MTTIDEALQLVLEADAEIKRLRHGLQLIADGFEEWDDYPDTSNHGTVELSREDMQRIATNYLGV